MNNYSNDVINQITLNCLISKSQLMKINNNKAKKNIDIERNKKIKKYNLQLIELFEKLLNKTEPSELFDDVKSSYVHFIDKSIIYLDHINTNIIDENIIDEKNNINNPDIQNDELLNDKINNMMNCCYDNRYHEMIIEQNEEKEKEKEKEEEIYDDEDDEDDEY